MMDGLDFAELVTLATRKQLYVLEWVPGSEEDGHIEAFALVVMRREGGFLVALPVGFLTEEELTVGMSDEAGPLGPSAVVDVAGVLDENGQESPIGADITVLLVDMDASVASQFRLPEEVEDMAIRFSTEDQFATPLASALISRALEWASSRAGSVPEASDAWYSADQFQPETPAERTPTRRARRAQVPDGGTPSGKAAAAPKRRPTTASLQASLDAVVGTLPALSDQMSQLMQRQVALENQVATSSTVSAKLAQPLTAHLPGRLGAVAKALGSPPRVGQRSSLVMDRSSAPQEVVELSQEKAEIVAESGSFAQAMMAQSQALTTLVAHLASSSQDPMSDLQVPGSTSTRGAAGRARLQAELALHRGVFFDSVVRQMSRRMSPTTTPDRPHVELIASGISGSKYLERYGGYGRQRELGIIMSNVMSVFDMMMVEDWGGAKDALALLAVMVEQATLDSGKFDIAQILTLQEDIPAAVFTNRQMSSMRARSFAPLADAKWVTTAIAFLKELETISSKRNELLGRDGGAAASAASAASSKAQPKRRGKGKGRGQPTTAANNEEEDQ